ncbi:MAG: hypothetical protein QOH39_3376 [Verrucomicrobiota bacterium]|jgi:hypothetical protein
MPRAIPRLRFLPTSGSLQLFTNCFSGSQSANWSELDDEDVSPGVMALTEVRAFLRHDDSDFFVVEVQLFARNANTLVAGAF